MHTPSSKVLTNLYLNCKKKKNKKENYLNLQSPCKCHLKGTLDIFHENSLESLLEQRCVERVRHDHITSALTEKQKGALYVFGLSSRI